MQTYKGEINEFINWTSGVNDITGSTIEGVSSNNPISGKSIRELIQNKLKTPFIADKDDTTGYLRFFSSEEGKRLWKLYSDADSPYRDPEIALQFLLCSMELPATYKITGLPSDNARYIIDGNSESQNAIVDFTLGLENSMGESDSDNITVRYKITDGSGNVTYQDSVSISTGTKVQKNLYNYLKSGDNYVEISFIANNHAASANRNFHIYLVTFSLSSSFSGYYNGVAPSSYISFIAYVNRSITDLPVTTKVFVDDLDINHTPVTSWTYTYKEPNPSDTIRIDNRENVYAPSTGENAMKHTMVMFAQMENAEIGVSFKSNILIYEFEVASSEIGIVNQFVNTAISIPSNNYYTVDDKVVLRATQYMPFTLDWGYYSDGGETKSANVSWAIRTGQEGSYVYTDLGSITGSAGVQPERMMFIPSAAMSYESDNSYLVARIDGQDVSEYPIDIVENSVDVHETVGASLKLSAYGKTNATNDRNTWEDTEHSINTTFSSAVSFDNTNGWDNNSLVLKGTQSYATVNYIPFPNDGQHTISTYGATFEVDFKPEQVFDENDNLIVIGDINAGHIIIKPNSAGYYEGNTETPIVKTNYKTGERIKLAFIFNITDPNMPESSLIYIVNNGILERAASRTESNGTYSNNGLIKIGGSNSGVRVYSIRAYRMSISPRAALNNYMFDHLDDSKLISRNDIYGNVDAITKTNLIGKQDIITITGDLSDILRNASFKRNATVNIQRESNTDGPRDFTVTECRIRNHGQSTLSYPITSMKIWLNKSGLDTDKVPEFICTSQAPYNFNKNRYVMKAGAIPSNKFVLQANYADSSGSHNGSLLRLINDTWYNAKIGDNKEYKLRTAPQLFASGYVINHDNPNLNEDGNNAWVEGAYNVSDQSSYYKSNYAGLTWPEITNTEFPYKIRIAPDSFPCTVFYTDTSTDALSTNLLGQYVFMDDKKSDYVYGERSIYYTSDPADPFCLKYDNKNKDTNTNKVWDNKDVLQIEVVYPNSPLTSYNSLEIAEQYQLDENDQLIPGGTGAVHRYDDAAEVDQQGNTTKYYWELHFELIYPDKEDIVDKNTGLFSPSKFQQTVKPFMDFLDWIVGVADKSSVGSKLGDSGAAAHVTQAELDMFIEEAHDHLDLYKLAAYYIFFLRFGLVDSVERNAQLKTYDGLHWHYEPWDMDIALGTANNGTIAYDPPLTRDTKAGGSTYAFAGRSGNQSNTLWDCLECWDYWANTIVPEVAEALYNAGLTYDNAIKMFDENYVEKWSEALYNDSGYYKYIKATNDSRYRKYLNGARASHRHWWLSKSMNYYDAKWSCGDFKKHYVQFRIGKPAFGNEYNIIKIYPTSETFFKAEYVSSAGDVNAVTVLGQGLTPASVALNGHALIDISGNSLDDKMPCYIYGATSIEELDLSSLLSAPQNTVIGKGYTDISFGNSYDNVLGAQIKRVKIGAPCIVESTVSTTIYDNPNATQYYSNLSVGGNVISGSVEGTKEDALENLELLDMTGFWTSGEQADAEILSKLFYEPSTGVDRKNIHTLYAMGCNQAETFSSSNTGNKFNDLRLPSSITTIQMTNSSWENISFWDAEKDDNISTMAHYTKVTSGMSGRQFGIPATIRNVGFKGTTARNECSLQFVLGWISSIESKIRTDHPLYDDDGVENALYAELLNCTLQAEQIEWGTGDTKIYYKDVVRLSKFRQHDLKGYVVISDNLELTSEQLSALSSSSMFGSNVFNIGSKNNNLVVDQNIGYVRISVSGHNTDSETGHLYINEKNQNGTNGAARLSATSFTLSASSFSNYVISQDHNSSMIDEGEYVWSIGSSSSDNRAMYNSVSLSKKPDGSIWIEASEGKDGNYPVVVSVFYKNGSTVTQDTVTLYIHGVTYPSNYQFMFYNGYNITTNIRTFYCTQEIGEDLIGQQAYALLQSAPMHVVGESDRSFEVKVIPVGDYTATMRTVSYKITQIGGDNIHESDWLVTGSSEFLSYNPVSSNGHLRFNTLGINGGINLQTTSTLPETIEVYRILAQINMGGMTGIFKNLILLVFNDSSVIVPASDRSMYDPLATRYNAMYTDAHLSTSMYKSHLLGLTGSIDFTNSGMSSLIGSDGTNILTRMKYVNGLIFDGLVGLLVSDSDFANIANLETLSFDGCVAMNTWNLNLTNYPNLTTLNVENTTINVIVPEGSPISTLKLGSPTKVSIDSPTVLGNSGTTVSIQDSTNLMGASGELILRNINTSFNGLHGFEIFDILTSATT